MHGRKQTDIHTHARAQCSHANVGLAQARPNYGPRFLDLPWVPPILSAALLSDRTVQDLIILKIHIAILCSLISSPLHILSTQFTIRTVHL